MNKKLLYKTILSFFPLVTVVSLADKSLTDSNYNENEGTVRALEGFGTLKQIISQFLNRRCAPKFVIKTTDTKISASDGAEDDHFGYSVGIFGEKIVVGAYDDDDIGEASGSIHIFADDGSLEQKVVAVDGKAGDKFGVSLDVATNFTVVGAHRDIDTRGSAFIVPYTNTSNMIKILAEDGTKDDFFGWRVAASDSLVAVGAPSNDNQYGASSGAVYLFTPDGNEIEKLMASDGIPSAKFGRSVALSEDYVIVGSDGYNDREGKIYVYQVTDLANIEFVGGLQDPKRKPGDRFGRDVDIFNETIVVGIFKDVIGEEEGTAHISRVSDLEGSVISLKAPSLDKLRESTDAFGFSVAVSQDIVAVGAPRNENVNGVEAGCVYLYDTEGKFRVQLIAHDGKEGEKFGTSVAISGNTLVVGAETGDGTGSTESGSAYIYDLGQIDD